MNRALTVAVVACTVAWPAAAQQTSGNTPLVPFNPSASGPVVGFGPNGATLRCRDGSYPAAGAPDTACDGKGGVMVRWPLRKQPPAAQPQVRATAPAIPAEARQVPDTTPPAGFVSNAERREQAKRATGRPPEGATLLCRDGTYVVRDTVAARCAANGGLATRLVTPRTP
jgi:hypothetical protein